MTLKQIEHNVKAVTDGILHGTLFQKLQRYITYGRIDRALIAQYGLVVQDGPFKGMRYIRISPYHALPGKLLGFYEHELYPSLEVIIQRRYARILNVGSAEGYHAVGLAVRSPESQVYAFDIDSHQQALCAALVKANGVENRVHIEGECTLDTLQTLGGKGSLVLMDCEGCERYLLDPDTVPALRETDILVEVHDFAADDDLLPLLKQRFSSTHQIETIPYQGRQSADYPLLNVLSPADRERAVYERGEIEQNWLFMTVRFS